MTLAVTAPRASEEMCQLAIVRAAALAGWRVHGERPARTRDGWKTPIQGHPGFPDLVMAHPERRLFVVVELKRRPNKVTPEQDEWHRALRAAGVDVRVWYVPEELQAALDFITNRKTPR